MSFEVTIKLSGVGESFTIEATLENSVEEIIEKCCAAKSDLEKERVTLVHKGRILKPEQKADELKLDKDSTIHLVRKPAPKGKAKPAEAKPATTTAPSPATSTSTTIPGAGTTTGATSGTSASSAASNPFAALGSGFNPFGGSGSGFPSMAAGGGLSGMGGLNVDPNLMSSMMSNPMFRQMMDQMISNPDLMNSMIENNPSLRAMVDSNPQMREMLTNPDLMRMAMSPEAIQMSMNLMNNANSNSMFGTMSGAPGSMPAPGGSGSSGTSSGTTATTSTSATSTTPAGNYKILIFSINRNFSRSFDFSNWSYRCSRIPRTLWNVPTSKFFRNRCWSRSWSWWI